MKQRDRLWVRGGFPPSLLAGSDEDSRQWRASFVRTFLERDLPQLGVQVPAKGKNWGFEFKYQDAPTMTKSMHIALTDLKLERLWVVYPGTKGYPLHEKVECIGLQDLVEVREMLV